MSRMTLKSKFLLALVFLIPFYLYTYREKSDKIDGTTQIFEIKNTEEVYNYPDRKVITIIKHYMIINPPKDLKELKTVVEKFYKDNPINIEIDSGENKTKDFKVFFYRESKRLPRNWRPNEGYLSTDRIEHHTSDLIAAIYWFDSEPYKKYSVIRKSSDKDDYGALIESIEYIDDKIIDQESRNSK